MWTIWGRHGYFWEFSCQHNLTNLEAFQQFSPTVGNWALQIPGCHIEPGTTGQDRWRFWAAVTKKDFVEQLISFIFDEAHCISIWAAFRKELGELGLLHMIMLCKDIPLVAASATLPTLVLNEIIDSLWMRITNLEIIRRPSTRPNIHVAVLPISSPLKKYEDLHFVLNDWKPGNGAPPKFLVFDDISDAVEACRSLRNILDSMEWGKYVRNLIS